MSNELDRKWVTAALTLPRQRTERKSARVCMCIYIGAIANRAL